MSRTSRRTNAGYVLAFVILISILALMFGYGRYGARVASFMAKKDLASADGVGTWGDSFGAFNTLVSTFAFFGIILTLILQARGVEEASADQHRQRFDASFFELLRLQREARRELVFVNTTEVDAARGSGAYNTFSSATTGEVPGSERLSPVFAAAVEIHYQLTREPGWKNADLNRLIFVYMRHVHSVSESTIAPYFRLIYSMLDRLRADLVLTSEEKARYGNLVRGQLSSGEVLLLGINSLAPISADMKSLVTEFHMLKYLPKSSMRTLLERFHDPEAFAGRNEALMRPPPRPIAFEDRKYRSMVAALHAERRERSLSRARLEQRLHRRPGYVAGYEEGLCSLSVVEFVDVARALGRHPAYFLRH